MKVGAAAWRSVRDAGQRFGSPPTRLEVSGYVGFFEITNETAGRSLLERLGCNVESRPPTSKPEGASGLCRYLLFAFSDLSRMLMLETFCLEIEVAQVNSAAPPACATCSHV